VALPSKMHLGWLIPGHAPSVPLAGNSTLTIRAEPLPSERDACPIRFPWHRKRDMISMTSFAVLVLHFFVGLRRRCEERYSSSHVGAEEQFRWMSYSIALTFPLLSVEGAMSAGKTMARIRLAFFRL
jgi:hypothetical protein